MLNRLVAEIDSLEGVASTSSLTDIQAPCDHASHSGGSPVHDTNSHSSHEYCYHTCSTPYRLH